MRILGRKAAATLIAAGALVLFGSLPASARWTIHDGNDATQISAPPGGEEGQTCADRLRGQSGWAEGVDDPTGVIPPAYAYHGVPYEVWQAPPGAQADGFFSEADDGSGAVFVAANGTTVGPATKILTFPGPDRTALPAPEPIDPPATGTPDNWVFLSGDIDVALPGTVHAGDLLGVKPAGVETTFLNVPVVDCTPPPIVARIDVLPGLRTNYVVPRLRAPVLPVLVYGSPAVSVRTITSVHLQNAAPGSVPAILTRPFDANHDGYLDRVYWFSPAATGIACGQSSVSMTGRTSSGTHFSGTDAIRTVC
jgi:hypothetical protein